MDGLLGFQIFALILVCIYMNVCWWPKLHYRDHKATMCSRPPVFQSSAFYMGYVICAKVGWNLKLGYRAHEATIHCRLPGSQNVDFSRVYIYLTYFVFRIFVTDSWYAGLGGFLILSFYFKNLVRTVLPFCYILLSKIFTFPLIFLVEIRQQQTCDMNTSLHFWLICRVTR
jgi:fatty-acid desaturase